MNARTLFISHNWSDKEFARRLADDLKVRGVRVWIDEGEIKLGDSLIAKIREGIDEMDYLAVVLSPNSVRSEWVKKEVDIAMNQEIEGREVKVLPLLYQQCDLPGFLKGKLYADFTTDEKYQDGLMLLMERLGVVPTGGELFIFQRDLEGRFLMVNDAFADAQQDDVVGKTDHDLYPETLARCYAVSDLEVFRSGKAMSNFEEHVTPSGKRVRVQVIKHPILDKEGKVVGVEGIYWTPKAGDD